MCYDGVFVTTESFEVDRFSVNVDTSCIPVDRADANP